jgi:hypothetical protein
LSETSGISAKTTTAIRIGVGAMRHFTIHPSNFMCMK